MSMKVNSIDSLSIIEFKSHLVEVCAFEQIWGWVSKLIPSSTVIGSFRLFMSNLFLWCTKASVTYHHIGKSQIQRGIDWSHFYRDISSQFGLIFTFSKFTFRPPSISSWATHQKSIFSKMKIVMHLKLSDCLHNISCYQHPVTDLAWISEF